MKAYIFFSVHEELFHRVAEQLTAAGVDAFGGFVWGNHQVRRISGRGIDYSPLLVFTRDLLPHCNDGRAPDLAWLAQRERELGISINRMLAAERHLLAGRTFEQTMRLAEVALREIAATYDRYQPDFVVTEDISCFHSYVHYALAKERGIPFWCVGRARLPNRVSVYSSGMQRWERVEQRYGELVKRGLTDQERTDAEAFLATFRSRPVRPSGMATRAKMPRLELDDLRTLGAATSLYWGDPDNPTAASPFQVIKRRVRRIARMKLAELRDLWDHPVEGERYVLYPIHVQPEASTLVQAPLYVDQVALIEDIAKSLPVGYRLYVKEHVSSRGRRPFSYYERIKQTASVRLLSPDEDTWSLIRNASAIAVITGTVGWEGLLYEKPVVTFGEVFFNILPQVARAGLVPKQAWFDVFDTAIHGHKPNHEALLCLVSAMFQATHPGFIGNSTTFPEALEPENIARLAKAIATEVGIAQRAVAAV